LSRSPTLDELAEALDCTVEQTAEAIDAGENYQLTSLDAPVVEDDGDGCALTERLGARTTGSNLPKTDRRSRATGPS
jgi:DNA-directed RNA polymerase specialized sigma subunit